MKAWKVDPTDGKQASFEVLAENFRQARELAQDEALRRNLGNYQLTMSKLIGGGEEQQEGQGVEFYTFGEACRDVSNEIVDMLIEKNSEYGNSAIEPIRVFSRSNAQEQLRVRIDDKLSRLSNAESVDATNDAVVDLLGYLILFLMSDRFSPESEGMFSRNP